MTVGTVEYSKSYFLRAYMRAVVGLLSVAGFWFLVPSSSIITGACAVCALACGWYTFQTRLRQMSSIRWDGEGIHVEGPKARYLSWSGLRGVRLSYFSTRRDGARGWMQLKIVGKEGVLRLDSDASGFNDLVMMTMQQADRLGLDVRAVTRHNAAVLVNAGGPRHRS